MKVVFLGTNGWYSTASGNTTCALIDSQEYYVVLDAGDGLHKLDEYVSAKKQIILFLSHLHLDHIIGFHALNKFRFTQNLDVYGYEGTQSSLRIIGHPYTVPPNELPTKVTIHDITEGRHLQPFPFTCKLLVHADQCLGYRLELDNKVVTYCTDTGLCKNLHDLSENADLLISECSLKPGKSSIKWPHLTPEDAASVAKAAHVGRLVLTHFDAASYRSAEDRKYAEAVARKTFPATTAAFDGLELEI